MTRTSARRAPAAGRARRLGAAGAAVAAACLLGLVPAPPAPAATPTAVAARPAAAVQISASSDGTDGRATFGVQPATGKKPDLRPNFSYSVTAGAATRDHIAVFNYSRKPLTLRLYASDGFTTPEGGFDLLAAKDKPRDAGTWLAVGKDTVTVKPRSRVFVPFNVRIPARATPGDHAAGIVAALATRRTDAKGNEAIVEQRVGARVYVRVAGELRPGLTVTGLTTTYHPSTFGAGGATVRYRVRNTGNLRVGVRQAVRVQDLFGGERATGPKDIPELLPGNELEFTARADGVLPTFRGSSTVSVTPLPVQGDTIRIPLPPSAKSAGFTAVSWFYALLAGLLLLGAAGYGVRRWRRRRGGPGSPARRGTAPVWNDSAPRTRAPSGTAARTAAAAALGLLLTGAFAPAAQAAGGGLTVTPEKGSDIELMTLAASGPCPEGSTNLITWIKGPGLPAAGEVLVGNSGLEAYGTGPGGGPVVPLSFTMRDFATMVHLKRLYGTYTLTMTCLKGPFDKTPERTFTGTMRFTKPDAYRDGTQAKPESPAPAKAPGGTAAGTGASPTAPAGQAGGTDPGAVGVPGASTAPTQPAAATAADGSGPDAGALAGAVGAAVLLLAGGGTWWWIRRRPAATAEGVDWDD
ncbi:hypothetical protein AB0M28_37520 [Streptomyces sp. NPDC051940]|uniref:hypothetical protein n=1 Tax=Streptomyces sp. NPDC051940 TaxID=3155675 RepID=UPI00343CF810